MMNIKRHKKQFPSGTYTLRMGHTVPDKGVNLAYLGNTNEDVTSGAIYVTDNPNYTNSGEFEGIMYPNTSGILQGRHGSNVPSRHVLITNIYTEGSTKTPLYYRHQLAGLINKSTTEHTNYDGDDVSVRRINGPLEPGEQYKVVLYPDAQHIHQSRVIIYTNFISDKDSAYEATYHNYDPVNEKIHHNTTELLNVNTVFTQTTKPDNELGPEEYKVTPHTTYSPELGKSIQGWRILTGAKGKLPPSASVRDAKNFKYKIGINIESPCNRGSKKTLKVGIITIGASPGMPVRDSLRILADRTKSHIPSYLRMENPHPYLLSSQSFASNNPNWIEEAHEIGQGWASYWQADIDMPLYKMLDYDLLVIAGAGTVTLSQAVCNRMHEFVANGGTIWVDNNGTDAFTSLTLASAGPVLFPVEHLFELQESTLDPLLLNDYMGYLSRYRIAGAYSNDKIMNTVVSNLPAENITHVIAYGEQTGAVQAKLTVCEYPGSPTKGRVILSSAGVFGNVIENETQLTSAAGSLAANIFLRLVENRWLSTELMNSNILSKNATLDIDYGRDAVVLPYVNGYSNDAQPSIVALRRLYKDTRNLVRRYASSTEEANDVRLYVDISDPSVHVSPVRPYYTLDDTIYVYTDASVTAWHIDKKRDADVLATNVSFNYTIEAFTHIDGVPQLSFEDIEIQTVAATVSAGGVVRNLGYLRTKVPGLRSGADWFDRTNVFYRIRIGHYSGSTWVPGSTLINLQIYNQKTDTYIVAKNGEIALSAYEAHEDLIILGHTDHHYRVVETDHLSVKAEQKGIQLRDPVSLNESEPWYVRVRNGEALADGAGIFQLEGDPVDSMLTIYEYSIPEFTRQIFSPRGQHITRQRVLEITRFVDNDLIQVSHTPLTIAEEMPIQVYRRDYRQDIKGELLTPNESNTVFAAVNTNWLRHPAPTLFDSEGAVISPTLYEINYNTGEIYFPVGMSSVSANYSYAKDTSLTIAGYDANSGLIRLDDKIEFTNTILTTYYYKEKYMTYAGYKDDLGRFLHLDLNPAPGHLITYPVVNSTTKVVELKDVDTYTLIGKTIYIYMLPAGRQLPINYTDSYTDPTTVIRHVFSKQDWLSLQQSNPGAILLGKVQVREASTVNDLALLDTRQRGGGLDVSLSTEDMYEASGDEHGSAAEHYWDIGDWNGKAYQTQGVAAISIPRDALYNQLSRYDNAEDSANLQRAEEEIRELIQKHMALGVFPVINYTLTGKDSVPGTIKIIPGEES